MTVNYQFFNYFQGNYQKILSTSIYQCIYNQLSMRNNSFRPAESIQSPFSPSFSSGQCVRDRVEFALSLARILRGLGEAASRSRLRPDERLWVRAGCTVCVPRWIAEHCETISHTTMKLRWVCAGTMRAFKKSIQSLLHLYLWRKFSFFRRWPIGRVKALSRRGQEISLLWGELRLYDWRASIVAGFPTEPVPMKYEPKLFIFLAGTLLGTCKNARRTAVWIIRHF